MSNASQQSVHLTGGILRHFRAFSTPEQNLALEVLSTPAHTQVTQTVRAQGDKMWFFGNKENLLDFVFCFVVVIFGTYITGAVILLILWLIRLAFAL